MDSTENSNYHGRKYYNCCETKFFFDIIFVCMDVVFAGLMNGLTIGYMSMNRVDLEVLVKSGVPRNSHFALKILSLIKRRHLLLCTLVICKAAAFAALPIFLHQLVPEKDTILISATLILVCTEVIPHSVCCRYGMVIGAAMAPSVHLLVWICFPVAYPISKLLDFLLGKGRMALYRRQELKTLVDLLANEAGKGGDLSCDEVSIIKGALELTEKTARDAMTLASEVFAVDVNAKLDRDLVNLIIDKGHSRLPVYHEQPENIIGLVLVKNLLTINPADEVPVKNVTVRSIPRVPETMPLVQLLNEFQRGLSHMAVVTRPRTHTVEQLANVEEVRLDVYGESLQPRRSFKRSLRALKVSPGYETVTRIGNSSSCKRWSGESHPEILNISDSPLSTLLTKEDEVIGIITMEDIIEELLKEDIYDEMDHPGSSRTRSFHGSSRRVHDIFTAMDC